MLKLPGVDPGREAKANLAQGQRVSWSASQ